MRPNSGEGGGLRSLEWFKWHQWKTMTLNMYSRVDKRSQGRNLKWWCWAAFKGQGHNAWLEHVAVLGVWRSAQGSSTRPGDATGVTHGSEGRPWQVGPGDGGSDRCMGLGESSVLARRAVRVGGWWTGLAQQAREKIALTGVPPYFNFKLNLKLCVGFDLIQTLPSKARKN
jgi:hypothetical protein